MSIETLNCPNCGAGVASDHTRCEFCKTRLKTIGCAKCLGLMFVGTKFCGHCGAMTAPLDVSLDDDSGDCPRCRNGLETLRVGATAFRGCTGCDGLWVGVNTFENVCADGDKQSAVLGFLKDRISRTPSQTKVNYVRCPDCGQLMNRNNFARASGVIVDICKQHGVWFDVDELPAIFKFIQKGGLEIARERESAEIRGDCEELREDQRKQAAQDRSYGVENMGNVEDNPGIRGFVRSLFD